MTTTLRKTLLSASILAALSFTGAAVAQEAAADASATDLDTVVVRGIRAAEAASLAAKRDEVTRVEVISSEDIGKMPDKNVADSLARVSGVNISAASANEGAFDENDRVSMRGTPPSFTQTLIDGHSVATGDWFVLNQTGTVGRSVSYSLLPAELVDQVMVRKSSEAKLVEGGAVGNIDIITRNPLNFDTGFSVFGSVGAVYADKPEKWAPQLSVLGNWKNDAGTFGVTVQAFSEERHLRRDGQELLGYEQIAADSAIAASNPDLAGVYYPTLIGSALFEQERKRTGGKLTFQLRPTDNTEFEANYFRSDLKADNYNRNYMLWGARILGQGNGQAPDPGYVVRNGTLVSANFTGVEGQQYGIYDEISRPGSKSSTEFLTLDGKWNATDSLTLSFQAGTSEGHGKTPTQDVAEWDLGFGTGAGWQLNGVGAADWNLGSLNTSVPGVAGVDYRLDWIFGFQDIDVEDSEDWLKLDGEYYVGGTLSTIEFGVRDARHERGLDRITAQGPGCIDSAGNVVPFDWSQPYWCPVGTQSPADPANFPVDYRNYPGDFANGIGGNFPRDIWYHSMRDLAEYNRLTNRDPVERFFFPGAYALEERSTAAYTQFNFEGDNWSGNIGVRYVRTEEEVTNYVNTDATDPDAITTSAFGPFKQVVTKNTYNDWLPSANFRYSLNDDMVLRFAASRTLTRPDFSALSGAISLSPPATEGGVGTGTGGNPNLEPIISTNLDGTFEWYYAERALLSASLFSMNIDNYVSLGIVRQQFLTIDNLHPDGVLIDYDLSVPVGTGAKVKGIELAWEAPIGEYFGAFANYTYADGETDDGSPMLGTSKNTYNLGAYFENDLFSARVNYTYRSEFYSGLDRASAFYQDEIDSLSASLGWKISDNFSLSLDALNLNNPKTKYYAENRDRPRSIYENGRQYYLNLRFNY
ncbi:TonB-dependent receptor [Marilutibacter alkalisoli]|uniref:TonB-dependent receptor n=1 Tax=Marilutibacter alkalisoli TaxID=2591633 RepID=A0A514BVN2_9GAMM|nr:TonB-dependent receptor [Lysobacter alkalisoli]QDH71454.1 TonB-dependent receptor [Lysobacter alkalisoli]